MCCLYSRTITLGFHLKMYNFSYYYYTEDCLFTCIGVKSFISLFPLIKKINKLSQKIFPTAPTEHFF